MVRIWWGLSALRNSQYGLFQSIHKNLMVMMIIILLILQFAKSIPFLISLNPSNNPCEGWAEMTTLSYTWRKHFINLMLTWSSQKHWWGQNPGTLTSQPWIPSLTFGKGFSSFKVNQLKIIIQFECLNIPWYLIQSREQKQITEYSWETTYEIRIKDLGP